MLERMAVDTIHRLSVEPFILDRCTIWDVGRSKFLRHGGANGTYSSEIDSWLKCLV